MLAEKFISVLPYLEAVPVPAYEPAHVVEELRALPRRCGYNDDFRTVLSDPVRIEERQSDRRAKRRFPASPCDRERSKVQVRRKRALQETTLPRPKLKRSPEAETLSDPKPFNVRYQVPV